MTVKEYKATAKFDTETKRLLITIHLEDIENADREVESVKCSIIDAGGSYPCKLDYWPYSSLDKDGNVQIIDSEQVISFPGPR